MKKLLAFLLLSFSLLVNAKQALEVLEQKSELYNEIQNLKDDNTLENISLSDKIQLQLILLTVNFTIGKINKKPIIIHNKNGPILYNMICDLCKKFDLNVPTLIVFFPDLNNAGVFSSSTLILGGRLIEKLDENELIAVIGHELAHIKCNHLIKRLSIAALILILLELRIFKIGELISKLKVLENKVSDSLILKFAKYIGRESLVGCISAPEVLISIITLQAISRMHEKEADLKSVEITGKSKDLITALSRERQCQCVKANGYFAKFKKLFETHPTTRERVEYLTAVGNLNAKNIKSSSKEMN
ncbi:MAG: M48 family metalloprotease [Candidatus Babeliales bacterium]|nr:M48 family metalloprotease [Candidatus Babeliales bacterium]